MSQEATVLFDAPGPRARARHRLLTAISAVLLLAVTVLLAWRFNDKGQFEAKLWNPFLKKDVWQHLILPGLWNTLKAALVASVLAIAFGIVFGLARLSDHRWVRVPAGIVVEFFRAIPLLILIFLVFFVPNKVSPVIAESPFGTFQRILVDNVFSIFGVEINAGVVTVPAFAAVVFGLVMYNGSVLAEVVRAGVNSIPRGQSEAAYSIGLRKNGVMRLVLLPQAVTVMMPADRQPARRAAQGHRARLHHLLRRTAPGRLLQERPAELQQQPDPGGRRRRRDLHRDQHVAEPRGDLAGGARSRRSRKTQAKTMGAGAGAPPPPAWR